MFWTQIETLAEVDKKEINVKKIASATRSGACPNSENYLRQSAGIGGRRTDERK